MELPPSKTKQCKLAPTNSFHGEFLIHLDLDGNSGFFLTKPRWCSRWRDQTWMIKGFSSIFRCPVELPEATLRCLLKEQLFVHEPLKTASCATIFGGRPKFMSLVVPGRPQVVSMTIILMVVIPWTSHFRSEPTMSGALRPGSWRFLVPQILRWIPKCRSSNPECACCKKKERSRLEESQSVQPQVPFP